MTIRLQETAPVIDLAHVVGAFRLEHAAAARVARGIGAPQVADRAPLGLRGTTNTPEKGKFGG